MNMRIAPMREKEMHFLLDFRLPHRRLPPHLPRRRGAVKNELGLSSSSNSAISNTALRGSFEGKEAVVVVALSASQRPQINPKISQLPYQRKNDAMIGRL